MILVCKEHFWSEILLLLHVIEILKEKITVASMVSEFVVPFIIRRLATSISPSYPSFFESHPTSCYSIHNQHHFFLKAINKLTRRGLFGYLNQFGAKQIEE